MSPLRAASLPFLTVLILAMARPGAAPAATPAAPAATTPSPAGAAIAPADVLARLVGSWDATMQMAAQDGSPPVVLNGTEVNALGGRGAWVVSDFRSQLEGHPFQGHALLSFDRVSRRFRRIWADSTSPTFWTSEGTWDPAASTLTMWIESVDSQGKKVRWREETVLKGTDNRTFTMFVPGPESTEAAGVTIIYHRRDEPATRTAIGPALAAPTPAHDLLRRDAGTWSVKIDDRRGKQASGSDKAAEVGTVCCGGLYLVTDLAGEGREPLLGHRVIGFDPQRRKYISAQVDTQGGVMSYGEGEYDPVADQLTLRLAAPDGRGGTIPMRQVEEWKGKDQRTTTLYATSAAGAEAPAVVSRYRRGR